MVGGSTPPPPPPSRNGGCTLCHSKYLTLLQPPIPFWNTEIQKVSPLWSLLIKGFKLSYKWMVFENFKLQFSSQHIPGPWQEQISYWLTGIGAQKRSRVASRLKLVVFKCYGHPKKMSPKMKKTKRKLLFSDKLL